MNRGDASWLTARGSSADGVAVAKKARNIFSGAAAEGRATTVRYHIRDVIQNVSKMSITDML